MSLFKNRGKLTTADLRHIDDVLEVVGESQYPASFKSILGKNLTTEGHEMFVKGALQREKKNKHDPNAVAVLAKFKKVGYLPADVAEEVADIMDAHKTPMLFVKVRIWGKLDSRGVFASAQVMLDD